VKNGVFVALGQRLMFISYPISNEIEVALLLSAFLSNGAEIDFVT
jgi:hypothetical protein